MNVGILVARLPPEALGGAEAQAAKLAQHLCRDHNVHLFVRSKEVPPELSEKVIEEFYSMRMATSGAKQGGLQYAKTLLRDSLEGGVADKVIQAIQAQVRRAPFSFLQGAESDDLLTFIQDEHPQTIALIISHLAHNKASEILQATASYRCVHLVSRANAFSRARSLLASRSSTVRGTSMSGTTPMPSSTTPR